MMPCYALKSPSGEILERTIALKQDTAWSNAPNATWIKLGFNRRDAEKFKYGKHNFQRKMLRELGFKVVPVKLVEIE